MPLIVWAEKIELAWETDEAEMAAEIEMEEEWAEVAETKSEYRKNPRIRSE